jgi:L-aspartate oxidase
VDAAVVVVGTGIAGLTFALQAARHGPVLIVTKKNQAESNTNYARGGIAAGLGPGDDPNLHMRDTLSAGHGLCHEEVVEMVAREGPARVHELIEWGVRFQKKGGRFVLGREGGHSRRRILKAGDRTGREIERALLAAVAADDGIRVLEHVVAVDLLVEEGAEGRACAGLQVMDRESGTPRSLRAPATMLAAGGCGQLYQHTTNPAIATGDGIAMAHRAGARIANMEFIQFHPTALFPTEDPAFLLTEAMRGEGAVLRRLDGSTFMESHDPRGSLAPRDVVARAIHLELERTGDPHVLLDVSSIPRSALERSFPGAVEGCLARGVDLFQFGIPVVPAAHYVCGGVLTDRWGRTSLPGLFASGEVACTGLHGANRLASNSLLEAVVFSRRAAVALAATDEVPGWPELPGPVAEACREAAVCSGHPGSLREPESFRERLRRVMWEKVGIVRSDAGLAGAEAELDRLAGEEAAARSAGHWSEDGLELRNLLAVGRLVVRSARWRKESRGLHFNRDHPETDDARFRLDTVM